jgi:hypothetical protein
MSASFYPAAQVLAIQHESRDVFKDPHPLGGTIEVCIKNPVNTTHGCSW